MQTIRHKQELLTCLLSFIPIVTSLCLINIINQFEIITNVYFYLFIVSSIIFLSNLVSFITLFGSVIFSIYWRSNIIANVSLIGYLFAFQSYIPAFNSFGSYLICLSFFHLSEFVFTALYNHKALSTDSFLLNHSFEYKMAAVASWCEFLIEVTLFPQLKLISFFHYIGLALVIFGEVFRKLAMYTAGTSFNHIVQEKKANDHILVTKGVYSLVRHPSYFGWFYWSIGTQVLLANPLCICAYAWASWKFFSSRIVYEEFYLIKFFGIQYRQYQKKVPIGIPFIKGCIIDQDDRLD